RNDPVFDRSLQGRLEQRQLVAVARVDGALRHADGSGDRFDRGAFEAVLEEQVERLVEQLAVALFGLIARRPARAAVNPAFRCGWCFHVSLFCIETNWVTIYP